MSQMMMEAPPVTHTPSGEPHDRVAAKVNRGKARHVTQRWGMGLMSLLLAIFAMLSPISQQQAKAQVDPVTGAFAVIQGAKTVDELCQSVFGPNGGGVHGCVEKIASTIGEDMNKLQDFGECVAGDLGKEDSKYRPPTPGAPGGGGREESDAAANASLADCLEKVDEKKDKEQQPEDIPNLSLYRMGSALTAFYGNQLVPGGPEGVGSKDSEDKDKGKKDTKAGLEAWSPIIGNAGMAGGFVAAPNPDFKESYKWIFGAGGGGNDATLSYDSVLREHSSIPGMSAIHSNAPDKGVAPYGMFGAMNQALGLDNTTPKGSPQKIMGSLSGTLMLAAYVAAGAVDTIFDTMLGLLQMFNPFRLMTDALTEESGASFASGMPSAAEGENGAFDDLRVFLGDMYKGFVSLGWLVTVPIFMGFTLLMIFLSRRYNAGEGLKKLGVRLFFLGLGVPLLGATYTGALDSMQGAGGNSAKANASKVVMGTYVDFDGWSNTRLQIPDGELKSQGLTEQVSFGWDTENNAPTDSAQANTRRTALAINAMVGESQGDSSVSSALDNGRGNPGGRRDDSVFVSGSIYSKDRQGVSDESASKLYSRTIDLLNRYRSGQTVSSSDFEGRIKGDITKWTRQNGQADPEREKIASGWVQDFVNTGSIESMTEEDVKELNNPILQIAEGSGLITDYEGNIMMFKNQSGGLMPECRAGGMANLSMGVGQKVDLPKCNMSALSMYNYLNTSFGPTSMRLYSPDNSTSAFQREEHVSVAAVGSGLMQYVYWFSSITLLASFALIGIFYGMALLFSSIKRGIQLIIAIPFGLMGFTAGIAKAVIYTAAMFLEIFMTLFAYKVIQEFMMTIPALIERPLVDNLQGSNGDAAAGALGALAGAVALGTNNAVTVVLIVTLVSTLGIIIFTLMALKFRAAMIGAMEEAVTQAINKILGTGVSSGRGNDMGAGLKQGLARGVGMGATHAMLSGDDDSRGSGNGSGNGSADGFVADADGSTASGSGWKSALGLGGAALAGAGAAELFGGEGSADGVKAGVATQAASLDAGGGVDGVDGAVDVADGATLDPAGAEVSDGVVGGDDNYVAEGAEYDIDSDGGLVDADGNPVPLKGSGDLAGEQATLNDVADFDTSSGALLDADGNTVVGADGNPITASDIHGIDSDGNFTDAEGAPLMDADGNMLKADNYGTPSMGEGGLVAGAGAAGADITSSLESDQAVADQLSVEGGLSAAGVSDEAGLPTFQNASLDSGAGQFEPVAGTGGVEQGAPNGMEGINSGAEKITRAAQQLNESGFAQGTGAGAVIGAVAGAGGARSLADNTRSLTDGLSQQMAQVQSQATQHAGAAGTGAAAGAGAGTTAAGAAGTPGVGNRGDNIIGGNQSMHSPQTNMIQASAHNQHGGVPQTGQYHGSGNNDMLRFMAAGATGSMVTRAVSNAGSAQGNTSETMREAVSGSRGSRQQLQAGGHPQQGGRNPRSARTRGARGAALTTNMAQAAVMSQMQGVGQHNQQQGSHAATQAGVNAAQQMAQPGRDRYGNGGLGVQSSSHRGSTPAGPDDTVST